MSGRLCRMGLLSLTLSLALSGTPLGVAHAASFEIEDLLVPALPEPAVPPAITPMTGASAALFDEAGKAFLDGEFDTAADLTERLAETDPDRPEPWHLLGLIRANQGRFEDSLEALDRSAELYRHSAEPLIVKGDVLLQLGRPDAARDAYAAAAERDPRNWRATEGYAGLLERAGDLDGAVTYYAAAVAYGPRDRLSPSLSLARLFATSDRLPEAVELMGRFAKANPGNVDGLIALGRLELAAGRSESAAKLLDAVAQTHPDDAHVLVLRARAHRDANRTDVALDLLEKAAERLPGNPAIAYELGTLRGATGDYTGATEAFRRGLDVAPDDRALMKGLSLAQFRLDDAQSAAVLAKALADRTDSTAADHVWLGVVAERLPDRSQAIGAYETALSLQPDNWLAMNNLASMLIETTPARAVTLAREAAQISGDAPAVRDTLAAAYLANGDAGKAVQIFGSLAEERRTDPTLLLKLGRALAATGDTAAARDALDRALALDPDFDGADEARALLSEL